MDFTNSRTNRCVLAEIETKGFFLSPTDPRQIINRSYYEQRRNTSYDDSDSEVDSYVSPDEWAIRQRGRRLPVVFSPNIDDIKQNEEESSEELECSNQREHLSILKDNPCKRLLYADLLELSSSQNDDSGSPTPKKKHIELPDSNCLVSALKSLNKDQLISLIGQITTNHPDIEKKIRFDFPIADLRPLKNHINNLLKNIYKALPKSRLISKTDEIAYHRVSCHVMEFKKCVNDEGRILVDSKQWPTVMEYVFLAWKYVNKTPKWDIPSHNTARIQCFKSLSSMCKMSLEQMKDKLNHDQCKMYENRLKSLSYDGDNEGIQACLQLLKK